MTPEIFASRRENLRALLKQAELEALLVSHAPNRYYLSGFELHDSQPGESSGLLLITAKGKEVLFTDSRFLEAALRIWPKEDLIIYGAERYKEIAAGIRACEVSSIGFESSFMSFYTHEKLSEYLPLKPVRGLVERLRQIKDEKELALLEGSCALSSAVFDRSVEIARTVMFGRSEAEFAWWVEKEFRERGAQSLSFPTIAAVDANAALPHASPGTEKIHEDCLILLDMGCRLNSYCSDQTRTFWVGDNPSERFLKTLELVKGAQEAALKVIKPGALIADVFKAAWDHFAANGEEKFFTHSLGHGIGLETHESPSLSPANKGTLESGMVVTVEPGLYYPEWGGVRWEYMVVLTEDGHKVL